MQNEDEENVYDDNYDEKTGIFHYNARGSGGAEQLEISQNQEIVNAKENGKTLPKETEIIDFWNTQK